MAKVRRVIRKLQTNSENDVQFWPVVVSLCVFGGFLLGVILIYLNDHFLFWPALIGLPIFIGALIIALKSVSNRYLKRTMQLALVLSLLINTVILIIAYEREIFARLGELLPAVADVKREKTARPVTEFRRQSRIQQELNERVEVDTPEPEPDELEKQETEPEKTPPKPQPLPVPKPKETPQPTVQEKKQQAETPPRQSKTPSRMSRQTQNVQLRSGVTANTAQVKQQSTKQSPTEQQTEAQKQTAENNAQKRNIQQQPSTVVEHTQQSVNRKQQENKPRTDSTSVAQLPRAIAESPNLAPAAVIPAPQNPNVPRQTQPQAKPNTSQVAKQTTSRSAERNTPQPAPTSQATVDNTAQRRQLDSPALPQTARTAQPQTSRSLIPPSVAVNMRATAVNSRTPSPTAKPPAPQTAQSTTTSKQSNSASVTQRSTPDVAPTTPSDAVAAKAQRRQVDSQPNSNTSPANPRSLLRNAPANSVAVNTSANAANVNNAPNPSANSSQLAAATTAPARQATNNTSELQANSAPTPTTSAAAAPSPEPNRAATRQPRGPSSTDVASAPRSVDRARTSPNSLTSPTTTNIAVPSPQGPSVAANPAISSSNAAVQRSPADNPSTATNARSANVQTNAVAQQIPQPSTERAQSDSQPSVSPNSLERPTAARSQLTTLAPTTPTAIESPAAFQANNSTGQTSNQPAPLVLNKATTSGTAGIGRTENLDRHAPTAQGAAAVAMDSAARARATQTETGSSFSPNATAQVRRSVADQSAPSASQQVTANTLAQLPGSSEPSTTNSTTSAVSVDSKSTADLGEVTASRGNVQVDVGPSRLVADKAKGEKAAGGGQPELNFESNSNQVVRQQPGGAPAISIAAVTIDELPSAPKGGGGTPSNTELNPDATSLVRADSGGPESLSAGPNSSALSGPTANTNTANELAQTPASRAEAAEAVPGELLAGGGEKDDEDEEERKRRLARAALAAGGPAAAFPGSVTAELPSKPADAGGGTPASSSPAGPVGPQATAVARTDSASGGPATGQPSAASVKGPAVDAGGGQLAGETQLARAEPSDGEPGTTRTGGGTGSPTRAESGPAFTTDLQANVVAMAGGPSSGLPQSQPLDARGVEATKLAGGAIGTTMVGPLGAMSSQTAVSAVGAAIPGAMAGQRRTSPADDGPLLAGGANSGSPLPRADVAGLPPGTLALADIQLPEPSGGAAAQPATDALSGGDDVGPVKRDTAGAVRLDIAAKEGPGGLGSKFAPEAGINSRRANRDSPVLRIHSDARIVRTNPGGSPGTSTAAVVAAEGFRNRTPGAGRGRSGALDPETEASIASGLVFLQRHQSPDGSWSFSRFTQGRPDREYADEYEAMLDSDTAATGLALLTFMGAQYTHKEYKYAATLNQGIRWLLEHQKEDGDLFVRMDDDSNAAVWLYSHSIAALALSEAYGMTQDPELREPTQKALDFLVKAQNPDRGGWRYSPGIGSDTSVTGWVFTALYSGKVAELNVPDASFKRVENWLNLCQKSSAERHLYRYNPYAPNTDEQRHGRTPNNTMTAVGLTLRIYLGWDKDDKHLLNGADYLLESLPQMGRETRVRYAHTSVRDAYYWYYATQVMAHLGGEYWDKWNARLHPLLLETQTKSGPLAGSWGPIRPTVDRWGPHGGRIYVTTLNLLSLEARHRILPIYKATVAENVK